jgi:hypothetical protein
MNTREQIAHHLDMIKASGHIGCLDDAIQAWLGSIEDDNDKYLKILEQKLAESRADYVDLDEDRDIDTTIGFETLMKEQHRQRLDQRWVKYLQTPRTVSQEEIKNWAAHLLSPK